MSADTQTLKNEIIAALDILPLENLKLLAEFVAFLAAKLKLQYPTTNLTLTENQFKLALAELRQEYQQRQPFQRLTDAEVVEQLRQQREALALRGITSALACNFFVDTVNSIHAGWILLLVKPELLPTKDYRQEAIDRGVKKLTFLKNLIIEYRSIVYSAPNNDELMEINLNELVRDAISPPTAIASYVNNEITLVNNPEPHIINNYYILSSLCISQLFTWVKLVSPHDPIVVNLTQNERFVFLTISGYSNMDTKKIGYFEQNVCFLLLEFLHLMLMTLNCSWNWNNRDRIPDGDQLIVQFPKYTVMSIW